MPPAEARLLLLSGAFAWLAAIVCITPDSSPSVKGTAAEEWLG